MKALLTLLLLAALGFLVYDDDAKRSDLTESESRAAAAEQQAQSQAQQVQQLTGQVNQLQSLLKRVAASPAVSAGSAPAATPARPPGWFQQRLNGANGVLDPGPARP